MIDRLKKDMSKPVKTFSLKQKNPLLYAKVLKAKRDLEKNGWAVIEGVITETDIERYREKMWDTLEAASSQYDEKKRFDRNISDYSTFPMSDLPPHKHGILETYRINHCEAARDARKEEAILQIFASLLGTTRLVCSLDRINWKFPGKPYVSVADWDHADQNPRKLGRRCIQSYLNISGTLTAEEPGNRFYTGSHLVFEKFTKPYRGLDDTDWFKLDEEMRAKLRDEFDCPLVKPLCRPGSLVMWDSRTVHSPDDGTDFKRGRCCFYMSYLGYEAASFDSKQEQKKREAFTQMRATPHVPFPQHLFGKQARTYGRENVKYLSVEQEPLFATSLKTAKSEQDKAIILSRCLEPDAKERLLFGFDSYSKLSKKVGLWNKAWCGDEESVLEMTPMSVPWLDIPEKVKLKRSAKRKRENETRVESKKVKRST